MVPSRCPHDICFHGVAVAPPPASVLIAPAAAVSGSAPITRRRRLMGTCAHDASASGHRLIACAVVEPPRQGSRMHSDTGAGGDNGSHTCGTVGKSQSVVILINPMISTRTRMQGTSSPATPSASPTPPSAPAARRRSPRRRGRWPARGVGAGGPSERRTPRSGSCSCCESSISGPIAPHFFVPIENTHHIGASRQKRPKTDNDTDRCLSAHLGKKPTRSPTRPSDHPPPISATVSTSTCHSGEASSGTSH
jgi:hypothetical protein